MEAILTEKLDNQVSQLHSAKIIQQGLLPKKRHFDRLYRDHFELYIPQNVISGDFYWTARKNELRYLVVGDCTGHGVSAALLSVLAINLFEYTIMNKGIKKTDKILKEVDKKFIESFKNCSTDAFDNPWIDLSIVCIDEKKQKIYFSSANRKMLHLKEAKIATVYKGSNYPIGGWQLENNRDFKATEINYGLNDIIYLGSDGFQDQIGGPKNRKYNSKNLHEFLITNSELPLSKQQHLLEKEFNEWKKSFFQLDDICIVGIRL